MPIHAMRTLLALYSASDSTRAKQILALINGGLESKFEELELDSSAVSMDHGSKGRERQAVAWLAAWAEVISKWNLTTVHALNDNRRWGF